MTFVPGGVPTTIPPSERTAVDAARELQGLSTIAEDHDVSALTGPTFPDLRGSHRGWPLLREGVQ